MLDRWCGYFGLILSILVCVESVRLGLGGFHEPGPGFLPFGTGVAFGILSIILILLTFGKNRERPTGMAFERIEWWKAILILASMLIYALILEKLGFVISTFLLMVVLLGVERKRWYTVAIVAITTALVTYVIFELWLRSQLPKGILGI